MIDGVEQVLIKENEMAKEFLLQRGLPLPSFNSFYAHRFKLECLAGSIARACGLEKYSAHERREADPHLMSSHIYFSTCLVHAAKFYPHLTNFLDLGCGSGFPTALSLKWGWNAIGVDKYPQMVTEASENLCNLGLDGNKIFSGDYTTADFWKMSVDGRVISSPHLIYLFNMLEPVERDLRFITQQMHEDSRVVFEASPCRNSTYNVGLMKHLGVEVDRVTNYALFVKKRK